MCFDDFSYVLLHKLLVGVTIDFHHTTKILYNPCVTIIDCLEINLVLTLKFKLTIITFRLTIVLHLRLLRTFTPVSQIKTYCTGSV